MNHKILIVDDSKLARMAMTKALVSLYPEWTRIEASNATDAINLVETSDIDFAVLDFNMPGSDGLTLARKLRELRPNMPLAVISANIQVEIAQGAQEVGATFLSKPLTEESLGEFLKSALQALKAR
jgi:CheY-like chemotaxis protein